MSRTCLRKAFGANALVKGFAIVESSEIQTFSFKDKILDFQLKIIRLWSINHTLNLNWAPHQYLMLIEIS